MIKSGGEADRTDKRDGEGYCIHNVPSRLKTLFHLCNLQARLFLHITITLYSSSSSSMGSSSNNSSGCGGLNNRDVKQSIDLAAKYSNIKRFAKMRDHTTNV